MRIDVFTLFPEWFEWFSEQRHVSNAVAGQVVAGTNAVTDWVIAQNYHALQQATGTVAALTFITNNITQLSGSVGGTNAVGWNDGTNSYWILLTPP